MNPRLEGKTDPRLARCEAELAECVQTLFRRCPFLSGFAVRVGAIELDDMTCHPVPNDEVLEGMRGAIVEALLELVDERPETALLMSGRTFARTSH
jgi:hypothetical protein